MLESIALGMLLEKDLTGYDIDVYKRQSLLLMD